MHGAVVMQMGWHMVRRTDMHATVFMSVFMLMAVSMFMPVLLAVQVHMNLHPLDAIAFFWLALERKFVTNGEFCQFGPQVVGADPKINQGGQIHVAADSGKTIVIQYLHKAPAKGVHLGK